MKINKIWLQDGIEGALEKLSPEHQHIASWAFCEALCDLVPELDEIMGEKRANAWRNDAPYDPFSTPDNPAPAADKPDGEPYIKLTLEEWKNWYQTTLNMVENKEAFKYGAFHFIPIFKERAIMDGDATTAVASAIHNPADLERIAELEKQLAEAKENQWQPVPETGLKSNAPVMVCLCFRKVQP